jgi:hypothetical protein
MQCWRIEKILVQRVVLLIYSVDTVERLDYFLYLPQPCNLKDILLMCHHLFVFLFHVE